MTRVSWEVIEGSCYYYYDRRKHALSHVRTAIEQKHPVAMNRWKLVGDKTSSTPVDLDRLLAAQMKSRSSASAQVMPISPLPARVWAEVVQALNFER